MDYTGTPNTMDSIMSPDIQAAFRIYATHWRKVNAAWRYPVHQHRAFEINIVLEGEQHMTVAGRPFLQQAGDILFIRPGVEHSSQGSGGPEGMTYYALNFDIDDSSLRRSLMMADSVILTGDTAEIAEVRQALEDFIRSTISGESDTNRQRLNALRASLRLLTALSGWALSELPDNPPAYEPSPPENAILLANAIEKHLEELVCASAAGGEGRAGIEDIAAKLGYSPAHCNRVFRQVYGKSPRQYLSGLIIRQAKLLLLNYSLSVEVIALRLGYRDASHFSKQFKRWTGLSPQGYRKLNHPDRREIDAEQHYRDNPFI
ncbi:AraC family transcriptional regulator [Paenibacillus ihumii]|uniref:AraC family transcriptional regulator n=1 Tax=Paenibacillus ihumii TaxID=687436 RepID=UPI0006D81EBB|nr:AraC family transcriptional regulator [Paenibacillus ihumii]